MKRLFTCFGATMMIAGVMTPAPRERVNLKDCGMSFPQMNSKAQSLVQPIANPSGQEIIPLKAPQKASMERKSVILYEDFSNVPEGSTVQTGNIGERYVDFIASSYYEPGNFIPNEYTPESGTWYGDWAFAGKGGTVVLQCYNPMGAPAAISTPLGDYSGDLTVTAKVRASKIFYGSNNEVGYVTSGGSSLELLATVGGYGSYDGAVTDMGYYSQMSTGQIYASDGWQEVTFKFRCESPDRDGYITLATSDAIEIDWIKITDDNTFLACPKVRPVTNFTNDSFTANWDPVRRSFNYYIDLYKQVYTADSGVNITYDFNDGKLPEGTKADEAQFVEGEGVDESTALMLGYDGEGAAFETPNFGIKLKSFSSKLKFEINDEENYGAMIIYDVLGDNGWEPYGYLQYDGFWTTGGYYNNVKLSGPEFEDMYYAVRFYTFDLSPENKVYIDDINAFSPRPFVLERVWEEKLSSVHDPDNDDYAYNYYDYTDYRDKSYSYTFKNLDPDTEYWYRVRSHNVSEFSIGEKYHAFGVPAPGLKEATNVGNGSYTANWTDAPKAQSYTVTNYKAETVKEDNDEYTILSETFANCTGEEDIDLMTPVEGNVDDMTDIKGWSGAGLTMGGNMLGTSGYYGVLITPPLMVNPARGSYFVYINAYGYSGDNLYIMTESGSISGYLPFDGDGCVSGWLEIPVPVCGERIMFRSYNYMTIGLSEFEVVQAVKAGDHVLTFLSSEEVPAGVQGCTFSGLDKDGSYAFGVVSNFKLEQESTSSALNEWMYVDMTNGQSMPMSKLDVENSEITETERFTVDGHKASDSYKGVVIVRMSDGSVSKKVVK